MSRKLLCCFLLILGVCYQPLHAQIDTTAYDEEEYEEEEPVTTTKKHIYDTSHLFFNWHWKEPYAEHRLPVGRTTEKKVKAFKEEEDFWYVSEVQDFTAYVDSIMKLGPKGGRPPSREEYHQQTGVTMSGNWLFLLAVAIFIAAVIYFLMSNKVAFFAPRDAGNDNNITVDGIGDNIFTLKYDELLKKALRDQDYRLATRILYLKTLRQLSDKGFIRYQPEFTNIDYLIQLRGGGNYDDFARVTRHYEYVWYGKFEVSPDLYERISQDFITVQNKLA